MTCEFCAGQTVSKFVTKLHWLHGNLYIIENVKAEVCSECGERYFHAIVLDEIDELLKKEHIVKEKIAVEVVELENQEVVAR